MKIFSQLDGELAHVRGEHQALIDSYWVRIQKAVLHFANALAILQAQ